MRVTNRLFILLCAVLAWDPGARADDQIRSYTVPKEHPAVTAAAAQLPMAQNASDIPVNTAPIQWTLPEGWQQLPPDGVRIGNFSVPGKNGGKASVAITSFPGEVGTEVDNVNRWRGQVGLARVDEGGISSEPTTVDSTAGKLFDFSGSTDRIVVALIRRNGATWFFKMTGDLGAVGDAKPAFMEFLKSVRFSAGGDSATATAATAPVEVPSAATPAVLPATAATDDSLPKWNVPANWVEKKPGPMLFKSFSISDNGASAAVTISFFSGAMGGTLANVNRWRGQMDLSPVEEGNLAGASDTVETAAGKATLMDIEGTEAKAGQRLIAAIVPHGENTWFYKLIGDKALVAKEKDSFVNFVKAVQYP